MSHKNNEGGPATPDENQPQNFAQQFLGLIQNEIDRTRHNRQWLQQFKTEEDTLLESEVVLK